MRRRRISKDTNLSMDIMNFLDSNPNPKDSDIHKWAEDNGYETEKVEEEIYNLASQFVSFAQHGLAKKKGFTEKDADKKELELGIKVEMEHTNSEAMAKRIALDHLAEMSDYYSKLKKMEGEKTAAQFVDPKVTINPDKSLTDRELARLMRQSIAAEEEAVHLYEFIVDSIEDEKTKEVIQDIANEEKVHVGEFQKLLENMLDDEIDFIEEGKDEVDEIIKKESKAIMADDYK